jgi:hypothetical protein
MAAHELQIQCISDLHLEFYQNSEELARLIESVSQATAAD